MAQPARVPGDGHWTFTREVETRSTIWARQAVSPTGEARSSIVGYIDPDDHDGRPRCAFGYVDGLSWEVALPDTSQRYDGDRGGVHGLDFRWEMDQWWAYIVMHNGSTMKPEFRWAVSPGVYR